MKWICGFQHILRLQCLLALSNPERWGSQLYSLSGFLHFIRRMKVLHYWLFSICLLTFWLVLGIRPVYAQDPTDTPTPTNEPLIKTATPFPTLNLECPVGQPNGMYTVTPDYYWLQNCAPCITTTPYYVFPTGTPYPWETVYPTPEVSPTGTSVPVYLVPSLQAKWDSDVYMVEQEIYDRTINPISYSPGNSFNTYIYSGTPGTHHYITMETAYDGFLKYKAGYYNRLSVNIKNINQSNLTVRFIEGANAGFSKVLGSNEEYTYWVIPQTGSDVTFDKLDKIELEWDSVNNTGQDIEIRYFVQSGNYSAGYTWINFYQGWNNGGVFETTPTPGTGYCSNVIAQSEGMNPEDMFNLPEIEVGWARCFSIGGYTIPLEWAQVIFESAPDSWILPGIEFCFKPLTFGTMSILGLHIDLDFIATAMAGVLLFRFLTRS